MRILILTTLALFMLPTANANGEHPELHVEMFDDLSFTINGEADDPELVLEPGTTYLVTLSNRGSIAHNFNIDLMGGSEADVTSDAETGGACCVDGGQTVQFEFTVPADASGTRTYWCDPHKGTMEGTVTFGGEEDNGAPGPGVFALVALLAVGALLRRQ